MDGHKWEWISESEVRATGARTKTQALWHCPRCLQSTIVDGKINPEATRELYAMEPLELDGTTVMDPLIGTCDEELFKAVVNS
jgi:hypothetical protein